MHAMRKIPSSVFAELHATDNVYSGGESSSLLTPSGLKLQLPLTVKESLHCFNIVLNFKQKHF